MPELTIKSIENENYYLEIRVCCNVYTVSLYPVYIGLCGFPAKTNIYTDIKKAKRYFNDLKRAYF